MSYTSIEACRVCGQTDLVPVLRLGTCALTGVFPQAPTEEVLRGPLELVWCTSCGLLQLAHTYPTSALYGENYGYRSGLNASMVEHLVSKAHLLERQANLDGNDIVLDIGSNDGTTLNAYETQGLVRVGMDPTGAKFSQYYAPSVTLLPEYFSAASYWRALDRPARLVTSLAMFYDLDDPVDFARQVASIMADDGMWHLEQSYMPAMLRSTSYDTVCHEHLEYYSLSVLDTILHQADLSIADVRMNSVNGGSIAITAVKKMRYEGSNGGLVQWLLEQEVSEGFRSLQAFRQFEQRTMQHRNQLRHLLRRLQQDGKLVLGYGASTKGNVLLQYCGIGPEDLPAIAEVNADKFGRVTPGTHIPIISEDEARLMMPDYYLVLPWHFRDGILRRERDYRLRGGRFIFPLPTIEIV